MGSNATPSLLPERVLAITPTDSQQTFAGLVIIDYGSRSDVNAIAHDVETAVLMGVGEEIRSMLALWKARGLLHQGPGRTPVRPFELEMQGPMELEILEDPPRTKGDKEPATQTLAMFAVKYVEVMRKATVCCIHNRSRHCDFWKAR